MVCARESLGMEPHKPVSVLIVDDEVHAGRALAVMLRAQGYRVGLADSAEQALTMLDGVDSPDAILVDVELHGMRGLELLWRLRGHRVVPIIVSGVEKARVKSATDRGVNFVRKPVDFDQLLSTLSSALGDR